MLNWGRNPIWAAVIDEANHFAEFCENWKGGRRIGLNITTILPKISETLVHMIKRIDR